MAKKRTTRKKAPSAKQKAARARFKRANKAAKKEFYAKGNRKKYSTLVKEAMKRT